MSIAHSAVEYWLHVEYIDSRVTRGIRRDSRVSTTEYGKGAWPATDGSSPPRFLSGESGNEDGS